MENYKNEMKKFNINENSFPKYNNAEDFAKSFKRCSIYKYGNISYSSNSNQSLDEMKQKEINNA